MAKIMRGNSEIPALTTKTLLTIKAFRGSTDNILEERQIWNKVVTSAGRDYLIHSFKSSTTLNTNFKYHAFGTGNTAESTTQTALVTEVSEARIVGSQDSTGNTYTTVATMTFSSSYAITEHGVLTASAAGTLLDRTMFAAVNVVSGDSIQATYTLTMAAGG